MRDNTSVIIVVGKRGHGKTWFVRDSVTASSLPKSLILDNRHQDAYSAFTAIEPEDLRDFRSKNGNFVLANSDIKSTYLPDIVKYVRNTSVVFEDSRRFINQRPQAEIEALCIDSKQAGNDIYFTYHSWAQVPPILFDWADVLVSFKTMDDLSGLKTKLRGSYDYLKPAWDAAMADPSKYANRAIMI